jgi:hypothetical protein
MCRQPNPNYVEPEYCSEEDDNDGFMILAEHERSFLLAF